jgi:hypothetical protein
MAFSLDRCAFGWSRFGSFSTVDAAPFVGPVWLFLERLVSLPKTLGFGGWKSLDFLGFSRPDLDLSIGYRRFSAEDFSTALLSSRKRRRNGGSTIPHAGVMDGFMRQA